MVPHKETTELTQLRCFGLVVRMADERYPQIAWKAIIQNKRSKRRPKLTWYEGIWKILKERGTEWKGVRAIARDYERWKTLLKCCTPTGRRVKDLYVPYGPQNKQ
jgi:hypothetical protein